MIARGEHLVAMRSRGIRLLHGDEVIAGKVKASDTPSDLGPQDLVIVALKANLLPVVAQSVAALLGRPLIGAPDLQGLDQGMVVVFAQSVEAGMAFHICAILPLFRVSGTLMEVRLVSH